MAIHSALAADPADSPATGRGVAILSRALLLAASLSGCGSNELGTDEAPQAGASSMVGGSAGSSNTDPTIPTQPISDPTLVTSELGRGATGVTRLSRAEYAATVQALLGLAVGADIELLPPDSFSPFDNAYSLQTPSKALVDGLAAIAKRLTERVLADVTLTNTLIGCVPTGAADAACFNQFLTRFGRSVLRRPLSDAELSEYAAFLPFAETSGDFNTAVGMAIRALLQDLEFVYR
ncbi:MAG TPA: DUF1595 domain-containing protein, partial [Polyangiaceae bacterium]|nr:DUF1595 domain-containing protein [Polyangiaceae bacterium]